MTNGKLKATNVFQAATLIAAGFIQPYAAEAQTQGRAEGVLEEVVVSARKTSESLQEVPASVTSLADEGLAQMSLNTVADAQFVVPGLKINADGDDRSFVQIRGVGITLQSQIQPGVGFFVDGVYVPYTSAINDNFNNLERMEVIRGPQTTLFGKNTVGGAINLVSKMPGEEVTGRVMGRVGVEDDSYRVSAMLSGPIVPGSLYGMVSASGQDSDGFYDHATLGGTYDATDDQGFQGILRWVFADDGELRLRGSYSEHTGPGLSYVPVPGNNVDANDFNGDSTLSFKTSASSEISRLNATFIKPLSEHTSMTAILGYDERDLSFYRDRDFTGFEIVRERADLTDEFLQVEVRFDTQFTENFRVMYAAFYSDQASEELAETEVPSAGISTFAFRDVDDETSSVYANMFWEFSPGWELAAGLRYDEFDQTGRLASSAIVLDISNPQVLGLKETNWSPSITLRRTWSDDLMTFATFSTGVRAGGFNRGAPAGSETWNGDESTSYEVGLKSSIADRATLNVSLYFVEQDGLILNDLVPDENDNLVVVNRNAGSTENYGLEAELSLLITSNFNLNAGFSYNHFKATDDPTGAFEPYDGEHALLLPDVAGHVALNYSAEFGGGMLLGNLLWAYTGTHYGSSTVAPDFVDAPKLDAFQMINASLDYSRGRFSIGLFGENLSDEGYWNSYIAESTLAAIGIPQAIGSLAQPRNYGVRFSYEF